MTALDLCGERHRGALGHEHEKSRRGAESLAGDAVLAGPAAVLVLNAREVIGHGLVPCFPLLAPLDDQRFADVHVAEEFLAAIGTEALDKLLVLESLDNGLRR